MISVLILAVSLFNTSHNGIDVIVSSDNDVIDPAKSVFVELKITSPKDVDVYAPDLRSRVRGFSLAEDFAIEPYENDDGTRVMEVRWRLVPEPCAKTYKIAPFAIKTKSGKSFVAGPVYFKNPLEREKVSGEMIIDPKKDLPPLSWRLVGYCALILIGAITLIGVIWMLIKYLARRVKEHRMSPVERAWAELDRLMKKGLPGRGKFKDFYVELTMVVRRYVQRTHNVKAPHLTTEEFFDATRKSASFPLSALDELIQFLRAADKVKFAGVKATLELADEAIEIARAYIKKDNLIMEKRKRQRK
jgi:hypothetical protein